MSRKRTSTSSGRARRPREPLRDQWRCRRSRPVQWRPAGGSTGRPPAARRRRHTLEASSVRLTWRARRATGRRWRRVSGPGGSARRDARGSRKLIARRARSKTRPCPDDSCSGSNPRPSSSTSTRVAVPLATARIAMLAPSRCGDTAYFTLFSASVWSDSRGIARVGGAVVHVDRVAQPIAEPHALDREIVAHEIDLVPQRHQRLRRASSDERIRTPAGGSSARRPADPCASSTRSSSTC